MNPIIFSFLVLVQQSDGADLISPAQQEELAYWIARTSGFRPGESPQARQAALDRERKNLLSCLVNLKATAAASPRPADSGGRSPESK